MESYSQGPDFEITEHGSIDLMTAIRVVHEFPATQIVQEYLDDPGECRPCIGFRNPEKSLLEFAMNLDKSMNARFEVSVTRSFLGFKFPRLHSADCIEVSIERAVELLTLFFEGKPEPIFELI